MQKVSDEESEQLFISRPPEIQIVPAVSQQVAPSFFLERTPCFRTPLHETLMVYLFQSTVIPGREYIQQQCKTLEELYSNGSVISFCGVSCLGCLLGLILSFNIII